MPRLDDARDELIRLLDAHYGRPPRELQANSSQTLALFESLSQVGLGLVATPKVAGLAFAALHDGGMLEPETLAGANPLELDDILKSAGVSLAIKSLSPLQKLARWLVRYGPTLDFEAIAELSTETIREEWRAINGIGLASTDALLLHGLKRVSYPVDRATYRILVRHGWLDSTAEYDEARLVVERLAQDDKHFEDATHNGPEVILLMNLSFWFERVGRDFCKLTSAECQHCPLRSILPPDGPVEVE